MSQHRQSFYKATISIPAAAEALRDRVLAESSVDPDFNCTNVPRLTMLNEVTSVLLVFSGGSEDGGANTLKVNTLFLEERTPFDKGYVRAGSRIFPANITRVGEKVNASLPLNLPFAPTLRTHQRLTTKFSGLFVKPNWSWAAIGD